MSVVDRSMCWGVEGLQEEWQNGIVRIVRGDFVVLGAEYELSIRVETAGQRRIFSTVQILEEVPIPSHANDG
jgi:hypothetical protein